jgi:O-antigen ligase
VIDEYLRELRRRLPRLPGRSRFVAEAEMHLRALAEEHGDAEAVRRFGSTELVVARIVPELAARLSARASWVVLGATLLFVVPFYAVPENTFPPATWDSVPHEILWKHHGALGAFAVAVAAALATLAVRGRVRFGLLGIAVAALLTSVLLSAWMDAEWSTYVPGTPTGIVWGLMVPLKLALAGLAVSSLVAVVAARRAERTLSAT